MADNEFSWSENRSSILLGIFIMLSIVTLSVFAALHEKKASEAVWICKDIGFEYGTGKNTDTEIECCYKNVNGFAECAWVPRNIAAPEIVDIIFNGGNE